MSDAISDFLDQGQITVHLGAHKTASTYLHQVVEAQTDSQAQAGLRALLPKDLRGQDVLLRPAWGEDWVSESRRRMTDFLVREVSASGVNSVLLCEENIIGSPRKVLKSGVLYGDFRRRVAALPEALNHPNVTFLLAIREYGRFFSSCVTTAIRRGIVFDFDDLRVELAKMPRGWGEVLHDLLTAFPQAQLRVWRYEDFSAIESDVLGHFGCVVPPKSDVRSMQTLSQRAVEHLMQSFGAAGRIKEPRKSVRASQLTYPVTELSPAFRLWPADEAVALNDRYKSDFKDISEALGAAVIAP